MFLVIIFEVLDFMNFAMQRSSLVVMVIILNPRNRMKDYNCTPPPPQPLQKSPLFLANHILSFKVYIRQQGAMPGLYHSRPDSCCWVKWGTRRIWDTKPRSSPKSHHRARSEYYKPMTNLVSPVYYRLMGHLHWAAMGKRWWTPEHGVGIRQGPRHFMDFQTVEGTAL